jgi:hypothetical protein
MSLKICLKQQKTVPLKKYSKISQRKYFIHIHWQKIKIKGNSNFMIIYSLHVLRKTVQGSDSGLWWVNASKYITLTIGHWPTVRNDDEIYYYLFIYYFIYPCSHTRTWPCLCLCLCPCSYSCSYPKVRVNVHLQCKPMPEVSILLKWNL